MENFANNRIESDDSLVRELEQRAISIDYKQIFASTKIAFSADMSHGNEEIPQHFVENAQKLREAGVTHFAIEIDSIHNEGILSRLNRGERVDLGKIYPNEYAEMVSRLAAQGIKIVAIDTSDENNHESKRNQRESDITTNILELIKDKSAHKILVFIGVRHVAKSFNPGGYPSARKRLSEMGINSASIYYHLSTGGTTKRSFGIPSRFDSLLSQSKISTDKFMLDLRQSPHGHTIPYDSDADWLIHI